MSEIKYFTYEAIKEIIKMPMEWRTRSLITFQYASGCRIGELLQYKHLRSKEVTAGLLKSKIKVTEKEIAWSMPNFKVKNESKQTKYPFVLKNETIFWNVIKIWLQGSKKYGVQPCGEQVFDLRQSRARQLIREQIKKYAKKTGKSHLNSHASHALRRSRGTHLAEIFKYDAYEIMDALGHSSLQSGVHYVATARRKKKMQDKLDEMQERGGSS